MKHGKPTSQLCFENVLESINQIVDYLWDDEARHYSASDLSEQDGHIFQALTDVRSWLNCLRN